MAWKVTAMDARMAAALAQGIDGVAAFCKAQGISRQTYNKWKRRFEREDLEGLRDRTRRPNSVPNATPVEVEDAIVLPPLPGWPTERDVAVGLNRVVPA